MFLASSVDEFREDRMNIGDFINCLNKIYYDKNLFFSLEKCEDMNDFVAKNRKQDEYDDVILKSNSMFVLVGRTIGVYTRHEFDIAYANFKLYNLPRISVYFKEGVEQDTQATAFKKFLRDEVKHFYGKYSHIDSLKFKIIMHIISLDLPGLNIMPFKDKLRDGNDNILDLSNVPALSESDVILQAEAELASLEKKLEKITRDNERYDNIAEKAAEKRFFLKKLRLEVFNDLLKLSKQALSGNLSDRQALAYYHMEKGEYRKAKEVLTLEAIKKNRQDRIVQSLNEIKLAIDIRKRSQDWDEIEAFYEDAIDFVSDFKLSKDIFFEYAEYLDMQRLTEKALDITKQLFNNHFNEIDKIRFYHLAAKLNARLENKQNLIDALYCFNQTFEYWKDATNEEIANKKRLKLVRLYLDLAHFWSKNDFSLSLGENIFRDAYKLLWEARLVFNNFTKNSQIQIDNEPLFNLFTKSIELNIELGKKYKFDENIHQLISSSFYILAVEAHDQACIINENALCSKDQNIFYEAQKNRMQILMNKAGILLEVSNQKRADSIDYAKEALKYFDYAMQCIDLLKPILKEDDELDIEKDTGVIHLNISAGLRKIRFLGEYDDESLKKEESHLNEAKKIFEALYPKNPRKYVNFLVFVYEDKGEYDKILKLLKHSKKGKMYIEALCNLGKGYISGELYVPEKAISCFDEAYNICFDLYKEQPDVYVWKLVDILCEKVLPYGHLSDFETAKNIIFKDCLVFLKEMIEKDDLSKFSMQDRWLDTLKLFCADLYAQCCDNKISREFFVEWKNMTSGALFDLLEFWENELKKDANLILSNTLRYINKDGKEDDMIEYIEDEFESPIYSLMHFYIYTHILFGNIDHSINFIANLMWTYKNICYIRITSAAGKLKYSSYLFTVLYNEYCKMRELLSQIDNDDFRNTEDEIKKLSEEIKIDNNNRPICPDDKTWNDIVLHYENIFNKIYSHRTFEIVCQDSVAQIHQLLSYAYFKIGDIGKAEKYLLKTIEILETIEEYDLANHLALVEMTSNNKFNLGSFYEHTGRISDAIKTWNSVLDLYIKLAQKYGPAVIDFTKTGAGFIGASSRIVNEHTVNRTLHRIGSRLGNIREETPDLFKETIEKAKNVAVYIASPAYTLIPFLYYEISLHRDAEKLKEVYTELTVLLDKHEKHIEWWHNEDEKSKENFAQLFYIDISPETLHMYSMIKVEIHTYA